MGESLVSKGADVRCPFNGARISWLVPSRGLALAWHQLSKGHRVNIPEPDTWMLPVYWHSFTGVLVAGGARQRICMYSVYTRRRLR